MAENESVSDKSLTLRSSPTMFVFNPLSPRTLPMI